MTTGLSRTVKDETLNLIAQRPEVFVGLFHGEKEISDRTYQRQVVQFSEPQGDELRFIDNTNTVRFAPFNSQQEPDHWAVFDAAGNELARYKLTHARTIPAGDGTFFPMKSLRIGMP